MQKNKNILAGFTLIELLLVIVILGILIVIALSVINPVRLQRRSRESVVMAQTSKICTALFACAAAADSATSCNTLALLGVNDPTGNPANSTYAVAGSSTVTVTGTMTGTAGSKNNAACAMTCNYNFGTGIATGVTKNATNCY